jgi:CubicO group peptidase (beta-lactamase class C family)
MNRILLLTLVIACIACSPRRDARVALRSSLDSLFQSGFSADGPGGAVLVARGDSVLFSRGYGKADLQTGEAITTHTLFNLGSISKTFVSYGVLMLQDEGLLEVDDSLTKFFPEFKNKSLSDKVKIRHLLTHTSGLPDNREVSKDTVFYLTANDAQNWDPVMQADDLVFEPGSQYEYSNPAFNGLAMIIEKMSGQKWQHYISEKIFQPAGMAGSTITDGAHPESGVAHGYIKTGGQWKEDDYGEEPTFCAAGNGGVWSSVEELFLYEKAMRTNTFCKPGIIADSREVKRFSNWASADPPFIGWSWFIDKTPDGMKVVGHTGTQGGFYCNYVSIPEKEILFVMLSNFPCEREKLTESAMKIILSRL